MCCKDLKIYEPETLTTRAFSINNIIVAGDSARNWIISNTETSYAYEYLSEAGSPNEYGIPIVGSHGNPFDTPKMFRRTPDSSYSDYI